MVLYGKIYHFCTKKVKYYVKRVQNSSQNTWQNTWQRWLLKQYSQMVKYSKIRKLCKDLFLALFLCIFLRATMISFFVKGGDIISIKQAKKEEWTKDNRSWFVDLGYKDILGKRHRYHSKKFATRREAKDREAEFKMEIKNASDFSNMTFKNLIEEHYNYQLDKVKVTTLKNYENMRPYFVNIENIKLEDFNIRHYEMWRQYINSKSISTRQRRNAILYT